MDLNLRGDSASKAGVSGSTEFTKAQTQWRQRDTALDYEHLVPKYGKLFAQFLHARGFFTEESLSAFISNDLKSLSSPFVFQNMELCAERVADAIENKESVVVYSDYDMDGMSGLAILKGFLKQISQVPVGHYQPHRFEEGYGVHAEAIEKISELGAQVVITVDTGITAFEAARRARELSLCLVITDHHKQVDDRLPDTPYIVNPNQKSDRSGLTHISGAGMAFFFCVALRSVLRKRDYFLKNSLPEPNLTQGLDFFTLGTVADVCELRGDNRILVKAGLERLNKCQHVGLRALIQGLRASSKYFGEPKITAQDVAFSIAPKLNAASRLGRADLATKLLLADSVLEAEDLVAQILKLNQERTQIQEAVFQEAWVQAEAQMQARDPGVLITKGPWHEGVLGIVAAKIAEKFHRAVIVLSPGHERSVLKGSMRAPQPLSCVRLLEKAQKHLLKFGGHQAAAGLSLLDAEFSDFCDVLWKESELFLKDRPFEKIILFDGVISPGVDYIRIQDVAAFDQWGAPFGQGLEEPLFLVPQIPVAKVNVLKEKHIRCQFSDGTTAIGFNLAEEMSKLKNQNVQNFDALVTPELNRFRDKITVQLKIKHVGSLETVNIILRS